MDSIAVLRESPNFDARCFLDTADRIASTFFEKTKAMREWIDESILFSDGLCICALCEMYEVDYLIESGRGFGGSTEMFARYFMGHERLRKIWSIDLTVRPLRAWAARRLKLGRIDPYVWPSGRGSQRVVRARLSRFDILELVNGDALRRIPRLVRALEAQKARIGLFIDGPKEEAQMSLATKLFEGSPSIPFAALDDVGPKRESRYSRFRASPYAVFVTSDQAFHSRYGWINDGRLPPHMREAPGQLADGVGILVNRPLE